MQPIERELSWGEVVSRGFSLLGSNFAWLVAPLFISAILAAIIRILVTAQIAPLSNQLQTLASGNLTAADLPQIYNLAVQVIGYGLLEGLVLWIISAYFLAVAFKIAYDGATGKKPSFSESFGLGAMRLPALIISTFLISVIVVIGLVLIIVPGIIFLIMFCMFLPAIMVENRGGLAALGRSRQLVSHRWGTVFMVGLIAVLIGILISIVFGFFSASLDASGSAVVQSLYEIISNAIIVSFLVVLYRSLQIKEGGAPQWSQTPPGSPGQVAYCSDCGSPLPEGAVACPKCGALRSTTSPSERR